MNVSEIIMSGGFRPGIISMVISLLIFCSYLFDAISNDVMIIR